MRHGLIVLLVACGAAGLAAPRVSAGDSPLAAAPAAAVPATVLPSTPAGRLAAEWFAAFNQGETAMRAFMEAHVSAAGRARRSIEDRMGIYRDMHAEHGALTPLEAGVAGADEVKVVARAEHGGRLSIGILCEPGTVPAFAGVRVMDLPDAEENVGARRAAPADPPDAGSALPPMTEAEVVGALRARLDSLTRAGAFSGAVLLARGDQVLVREGYGLASRESRAPNRPDTKFNLGSINKIFTQTAIQQLAAAGKLRLDDTIDRYLTDYPSDKAGRITVAQLLDHRAGTGDIFNARYGAMDVARLRTIGDWMKLIRDQPLEFEPGSRQEYSNAGYVLLGAIIEKVSGLSYYDYVRQRIFAPAGMTATDSYARDEPVPNRALGYTRHGGARGGDAWSDVTPSLPGRGSSAGGGYSTLDDMKRFADALRDGRLGIPANRGGLGIAGGSPGVNATFEIAGEYTAVVLANLDPPAAENVDRALRGWLRRAGAGGAREVRTVGGPGGGGVRRVIHGGGADDPGRKPRRTLLPAGAVDVPMYASGLMPAVDVMVNGRGPYRFSIDTGGAGTLRVDSTLAAELGLPTVGEVRVGDPSGRIAESRKVVAVDSIEIGGAKFLGLTASIRSMHEPRGGDRVDGILGFGTFADCLFTLDYPGHLRLADGALPPADGAEVLDYRDERGIPQVTFQVAGQEVDADVDAGSMGGFSLPESLAGRLPLAGPPKVVGHARTVGSSFDIQTAPLDGEITLGRYRYPHPTVEFQPVFPMANLGARVLRDFRVTFDARHRRMRLEQPAAPGGAATR